MHGDDKNYSQTSAYVVMTKGSEVKVPWLRGTSNETYFPASHKSSHPVMSCSQESDSSITCRSESINNASNADTSSGLSR